jgi:hypothetical protein
MSCNSFFFCPTPYFFPLISSHLVGNAQGSFSHMSLRVTPQIRVKSKLNTDRRYTIWQWDMGPQSSLKIKTGKGPGWGLL